MGQMPNIRYFIISLIKFLIEVMNKNTRRNHCIYIAQMSYSHGFGKETKIKEENNRGLLSIRSSREAIFFFILSQTYKTCLFFLKKKHTTFLFIFKRT